VGHLQMQHSKPAWLRILSQRECVRPLLALYKGLTAAAYTAWGLWRDAESGSWDFKPTDRSVLAVAVF
jgi:hypothetical protein